MGHRILVGGNCDHIRTFEFGTSSEGAPTLKLTSKTDAPSASWLLAHPTDPSVVFATTEIEGGVVKAIKFDSDGKGAVVGEVPSKGDYPTHLAIAGDSLIAANYCGGVLSIPISASAPYLAASEALTEFLYTSPAPHEPQKRYNPERQESAHPHQVLPIRGGSEVLVCDLGSDKVWRLAQVPSGEWEVVGFIEFERGAGPRHAYFEDDILYTVCELVSELAVHRLPPLPAPPELIRQLSTLTKTPPAAPDKPVLLPSEIVYVSSVPTSTANEPSPATEAPLADPDAPPRLAAEILCPPASPAFPTRYIYVTNRNEPAPEGDVVAVFTLGEQCELVNVVRTGMKHLRGCAIGPAPEYKYFAGAGQNGGGLRVFERVDGGKGLELVASVEESDVEMPSSVVWL